MDLMDAVCMWIEKTWEAIKDEISRFAEWWNV